MASLIKEVSLCPINNRQCPVWSDGICNAENRLKCEYTIKAMMTDEEISNLQSKTHKINRENEEKLATICAQLSRIEEKLSRIMPQNVK